jgi:hypothetical protein
LTLWRADALNAQQEDNSCACQTNACIQSKTSLRRWNPSTLAGDQAPSLL